MSVGAEKITKQIVKVLISDISGRKGLGDEWDQIDDEIKDEIREEWTELISKRLSK